MPDATGREDLIGALRLRLLLAAAAALGYNRLALGDSATRLATRAVALAAKGAGYALPASLQHFDARRAPSLVSEVFVACVVSQCAARLGHAPGCCGCARPLCSTSRRGAPPAWSGNNGGHTSCLCTAMAWLWALAPRAYVPPRAVAARALVTLDAMVRCTGPSRARVRPGMGRERHAHVSSRDCPSVCCPPACTASGTGVPEICLSLA